MRTITIYSILLSVLFTSCEKVIETAINDAEKKYVIEGVLTNQPGSCVVLLSQTKNFNEDNEFEGVTGATIQITEAGGATTQLTATSAGVYQAGNLTGTSGKTYHLSVQVNNLSFTATSTMPQQVPVDSIFTASDKVGGETRNLVNVMFTDAAAPGNNYRFVQYVNGKKEKQIFIRNDELSNGNAITAVLRYPRSDDNENSLRSGDQVQVQMQCIDAAVYKYWYSLNRSATGGGGMNASSPANPVTNINGGALGYFSAHTLQSRNMTVQ